MHILNNNKNIFNSYKINKKTFTLLKDTNYLKKRYLLNPDNTFYSNELKLKSKKSNIIFKIMNNKIYIMDILSESSLEDIHIKKFIKYFKNYNCSIFVLCNIYLPFYKILILNGFIPSNHKFNSGFSLINKNKAKDELIKNLPYFNYSLGDTDVF